MTFPDLDTFASFNTGTSEHTLIICKSPNKVKEIRNIIMGEHTSNGLMGGGEQQQNQKGTSSVFPDAFQITGV